MTTTPARKYNPGFLSDEELIASFCVRTHEFESLMEMLRDCTGNSNRHQIVIGPRGSGKTSLLLRVAAEVRRDADLAANFFPIVFAEESYEVSTAGEFWLECLARLAHQAPQREYAPDLLLTVADLRTIQDDQLLGERCLAAVLDFADREDKRLVLMVENLNMMFRDMMDPDAGWRLRKVLQTEPRIILLGSATSRFDEIDKQDHALYEMLRIVPLRRLTTKECAVLWKTVSGQSRPTNTIRSLEILTGGSPRLLAIVARFGAGLSFRELMDNLLDLVDDHTEYFRGHLESLPAQERRVYLALADLWKPALTKEIAERARLATSKCSAQLARLIERGVVRFDGGSARRKHYYLSERMYNIYYLLRRGQDRLIEVLIRFMATYYSPHELKEIGTRIAQEAEDGAPGIRALYQYASAELLAVSEQADQTEVERAAIGEGSAEDARLIAGRRLHGKADALWERNQKEDALATLNEVLRRFGDTQTPALMEVVAMALVNKGVVLDALNRRDEEFVTYDEVLHRYGASEAPQMFEWVAKALINKSAALGRLNRHEEAVAACDEVLSRYETSEVPKLVGWVAAALVNKAVSLGGMKRQEDALAACNDALRRFGRADAPELLGAVAEALVTKAALLGGMNRLDEALATHDEVVRRFEESDVPEILERVARALAHKAYILAELNRAYSSPSVAALLESLSKLGSLPVSVPSALMELSIILGPLQMLDLIRGSSADDLLLPLTTALERDLGRDPRVPQEVSEVAEDIRRDLAKIREARSLRAEDALNDLQHDAARRGLDQLTMDEIDEEIQASRKSRKEG